LCDNWIKLNIALMVEIANRFFKDTIGTFY